MRVNYEVDDVVHRRAKVAAATEGITLREFLERALEEAATRVEKRAQRGAR